MIDTGGTLVSACEKLRSAGVEEIYILVSHGLFTGVLLEQTMVTWREAHLLH